MAVTRMLGGTNNLHHKARDPSPPSEVDEPPDNTPVNLTQVQNTIVQMLARGSSDTHIASRLNLGLRTVQRHVSRIMQALNVRSRFQAGVAVARAGLLQDGVGRSDDVVD
ncbi:LuxR C-terminal-related transcriptional regulator [Nonomuraea sp. NPDC049709]|uniref:response regulator transcription factor n=1 Tax=Nonomuraea sp. NPDC049709 TaxID=3154736 RepID=UPI00341B3D43